jgi:hypothetical protein
MMGHPWKKTRGKPGITEQEFWRGAYPLVTDGTIARLIEIGNQRRRVSRMKQNSQTLQGNIRLLKRKINDFNEQGEENGKSKKL